MKIMKLGTFLATVDLTRNIQHRRVSSHVLNKKNQYPNLNSNSAQQQKYALGGNWQGYENNILRYYVDGETEASVEYPFGLGHGSTMADNDAPWSAGGTYIPYFLFH